MSFRHKFKIVVEVPEDLDRYEDTVTLEARWVICDNCEGRGKMVDPRIDGNGITESEFAEDPDFAEAYWAGAYDIACPDCGGSGKVVVPLDLADALRCVFGEAQQAAYREAQAAYDRSEELRWEDERDAARDRAIRRMEEGWR